MRSDTTVSYTFPLWQVLIVLVLFPSLYVIKDQLPLTPMFEYVLPSSVLDAYSRVPGFIPFWGTILGLHWISVLVVVFFLWQGGAAVSALGLKVPTTQVGAVFGILLLLGVGFLVFRVYSSHGDVLTPIGAKLTIPPLATTFERGCWIAISLSAGFCEELVYRGFGITALKQLGIPLWGAIIFSSISFTFIHGIRPVQLMAGHFLFGMVMSLIYVMSKRLLPIMAIHSGTDLLAILIQ